MTKRPLAHPEAGAAPDIEPDVRLPRDEPLVYTTRGDLVENVHRGRICVVSADDGRVLASVGDPDGPAYLRSTAKPFQALGPLLSGVAEAFGLDDRHLALMCASHRGSAEQVAVLEDLARRTGLPEERLAMRPASPQEPEAREAWLRSGGQKRRLYHMCAGKHLGVLAWCKRQGWPLDGYTRPDHPAQRETVARLAAWADLTPDAIRLAVDGCGLPVAAMPLRNIALLYGRLACPDAAPAAVAGEADVARTATMAMNRHPALVEGEGRLASLLLGDPGIVAKSGAQGVFAIGLRRQRVGVAIVVTDGAESAWPVAVRAVLERLGALSPELAARLDARFPRDIRSETGEVAGRLEAAFAW